MKIYTNEIELAIETKIKPNMKRIYEMKVQGYTDRQIARVLGISVRTFMKVVEEYEELGEIYESAVQILCSKLREVAITRALGTDGKVDREGNEVGPDANLAMRLLEKLDPQFSRTKEDSTVSVTVEHIIKEINNKRRLEHEEKEEEEEEVVV